jgi:adenine-specific DNA-methyltransferase
MAADRDSSEKPSPLAIIGDLFPECLTEAMGPDGTIGPAVDFDRLVLELADDPLSDAKADSLNDPAEKAPDMALVKAPVKLSERYTLDWPGKAKASMDLAAPPSLTLRPLRNQCFAFDEASSSRFIGDRLEILKILSRSLKGKIKLVSSRLGKDAGESRSEFLSKAMGLLTLSAKTLAKNGAAFIRASDSDVADLRKIGLAIFGERNFIAQFVVEKPASKAPAGAISAAHEFILAFAKDIDLFKAGQKPKIPGDGLTSSKKAKGPKTRTLRKWGDNSRREDRPNLYYPIKDPDGVDHYPFLLDGSQGCWRWGRATMAKAFSEGRAIFKKSGDKWEAYEIIKTSSQSLMKYDTWLSSSLANSAGDVSGLQEKSGIEGVTAEVAPLKVVSQEGGESLKAFASTALKDLDRHEFEDGDCLLAEERKYLESPLYLNSLQTIFKMAGVKEGDFILDFSDSAAATAKAIGNIFLKNGAGPGCIFVGEPYDDRLGMILFDAIHWFRAFKADFPSKANFSLKPEDINQRDLYNMVEAYNPNREQEDPFFEAVVDFGLDLRLPIRTDIEFIGNRRYSVIQVLGKELVFSRDNNITVKFLEIAARRGRLAKIALFRDKAFFSDALKFNAGEIFKSQNPNVLIKTY